MPKFVAIQRDPFARLRWTRPQNSSFAAQDTTAPIVAAEIGKIVPSMPIVFVKYNDQFQLSALLSLTAGRNMFVGPNGNWLGGYVPAAIRSYPFKLIRPGEGADPVLCIDEESDAITDNQSAGEEFFSTDGSVAPTLKALLDFLAELDRNRAGTQIGVASLEQAGVIVPWPILVKAEQGEQKIEGLFRIDEAALNSLPEDRFARLRATGALPIAFGQLFSMSQLSVFQDLMRLQTQLAPKPLAPLPDTLDKLFDMGNNEYLRFD
jgi:hypothetical protein